METEYLFRDRDRCPSAHIYNHVEALLSGKGDASAPSVEEKVRMKKKTRQPRDVNANVSRIFGEMIERSEKPPNRGTLKPVEKKPTTKKAR